MIKISPVFTTRKVPDNALCTRQNTRISQNSWKTLINYLLIVFYASYTARVQNRGADIHLANHIQFYIANCSILHCSLTTTASSLYDHHFFVNLNETELYKLLFTHNSLHTRKKQHFSLENLQLNTRSTMSILKRESVKIKCQRRNKLFIFSVFKQ